MQNGWRKKQMNEYTSYITHYIYITQQLSLIRLQNSYINSYINWNIFTRQQWLRTKAQKKSLIQTGFVGHWGRSALTVSGRCAVCRWHAALWRPAGWQVEVGLCGGKKIVTCLSCMSDIVDTICRRADSQSSKSAEFRFSWLSLSLTWLR